MQGKAPQAPIVQQQQPDPTLVAIQQQSANDEQNALTDRATQLTNQLLLRYGARQALGSAATAPLRATA